MLFLDFHNLFIIFSEHLVRLAFQCLQLVVTDFLPLMPWACLPLTVDTAAKFGSQTQELNISLTAIGLMVSCSMILYTYILILGNETEGLHDLLNELLRLLIYFTLKPWETSTDDQRSR